MALYYLSLGNRGQHVELQEKRKQTPENAIVLTEDVSSGVIALALENKEFKNKVIPLFVYQVADVAENDLLPTDEIALFVNTARPFITKEKWLRSGVAVNANLVQVINVDLNQQSKNTTTIGDETIDFIEYGFSDGGDIAKYPIKSMDIYDYYCEALKAKMYRYRKWVFDAFSIKKTYGMTGPYTIHRDEDKGCYYSFLPEGDRVDLLNADISQPPVGWWKAVTVKPGDLPNVKENTKTTTGEMFINAAAFCYQFDDLVPYRAGKILPNDLHAVFKMLREKGLLTVEKLVAAITMIEQLPAYCDIAVPAASRETFTTHPKMREKRTELLAKYKGRLDDPAVQAIIDKELVALDKEHIKGTTSEPFFIKDKQHNVIRKKTMMLYGSERNIDGTSTDYIETSLGEGWQKKDIPSIANALRAGAYSRGNLTALGGVDVKRTQRNLTGAKITIEDCQSKEGLTIKITEANYKLFLGFRRVDKPQEPLSLDMLKSLISKTVTLRTIGHCKVKPNNCCEYCAGDVIKARKNALAMEASNIGSASMDAMMQATHGKAVKTNYFDLALFTS